MAVVDALVHNFLRLFVLMEILVKQLSESLIVCLGFLSSLLAGRKRSVEVARSLTAGVLGECAILLCKLDILRGKQVVDWFACTGGSFSGDNIFGVVTVDLGVSPAVVLLLAHDQI